MKNKENIKLIVVIFIIIICIIAVASIIITNIVNKVNKNKNLIEEVYNNLLASDNYTFTMQQNNDNKTSIIKKGSENVIDTYSSDQGHTTTLIKNNVTYYILHDREEYYVYYQVNIDQNILVESIKELLEKEYIKDTEKVKGKNYLYQEYQGSTFFTISNPLEFDEENVKTRFYFDKDNRLVYIKTIYGKKEELLKIELNKEADESLFNIPSDYAENS